MKLNIRAFAFTAALIWGIGLMLITWWIMLFEGITGGSCWLSCIYRGYSISFVGSLIGLAWGLVDGFIGGLIFAWLYNLLCGKTSQA